MVAIVGIISMHGLRIEVRCRNQPNESKLALYKPLLHLYSHLTHLYISIKTKRFIIQVYVVCVGIHMSRHLKEWLVLATDKCLRVISNIMVFKTVIILYALLCHP